MSFLPRSKKFVLTDDLRKDKSPKERTNFKNKTPIRQGRAREVTAFLQVEKGENLGVLGSQRFGDNDGDKICLHSEISPYRQAREQVIAAGAAPFLCELEKSSCGPPHSRNCSPEDRCGLLIRRGAIHRR